MPELKPNKHGISYTERNRVKEKVQAKYSEELQNSFTNVKKHEFLVKKLKRKLTECVRYLEAQAMTESVVSLVDALQFLINEDIPSETLIGQKRKGKEEDILEIGDLLEVLSEARVYIADEFDYCIKCKVGDIGGKPCKHS